MSSPRQELARVLMYIAIGSVILVSVRGALVTSLGKTGQSLAASIPLPMSALVSVLVATVSVLVYQRVRLDRSPAALPQGPAPQGPAVGDATTGDPEDGVAFLGNSTTGEAPQLPPAEEAVAPAGDDGERTRSGCSEAVRDHATLGEAIPEWTAGVASPERPPQGGFALRVLNGEAEGHVVPCHGDTYVGRADRLEISDGRLSLPGDATLSRIHARFRPLPEGGLRVENLSQTSSTYVNETAVDHERVLQSGDRVRMGGTVVEAVPLPEPLSSSER